MALFLSDTRFDYSRIDLRYYLRELDVQEYESYPRTQTENVGEDLAELGLNIDLVFSYNSNLTGYVNQAGGGQDFISVLGLGLGRSFSGSTLAGTITGIAFGYSEDGEGGRDEFTGLVGVSVSANSLLSAMKTVSNTDDIALMSLSLRGADTIFLSDGSDKMRGFAGNDTMFGNAGNDTLFGDAGRDVLVGGAGKDSLLGGADADTFRFISMRDMTTTATTADVIQDFRRGTDKIDLSAIDASTVLATNNKFTFDGTAAHGTSSQGDVYYKQFNNAGTANDYTLIYIDTDADRASEGVIRLTGLYALTASDFIL